jgi:hypothetical protein
MKKHIIRMREYKEIHIKILPLILSNLEMIYISIYEGYFHPVNIKNFLATKSETGIECGRGPPIHTLPINSKGVVPPIFYQTHSCIRGVNNKHSFF